jgi:hypothetical protein
MCGSAIHILLLIDAHSHHSQSRLTLSGVFKVVGICVKTERARRSAVDHLNGWGGFRIDEWCPHDYMCVRI